MRPPKPKKLAPTAVSRIPPPEVRHLRTHTTILREPLATNQGRGLRRATPVSLCCGGTYSPKCLELDFLAIWPSNTPQRLGLLERPLRLVFASHSPATTPKNKSP